MQQSYLAKLVFEIIDTKLSLVRKFDEQLRVIGAENEGDALEVCQELGLLENEKISRSDGSIVEWKFVGCSALLNLEKTKSNVVFSYTKLTKNPDQYRSYIQQKNAALLMTHNQQNLVG